jgi:uncharacterized membrane protein
MATISFVVNLGGALLPVVVEVAAVAVFGALDMSWGVLATGASISRMFLAPAPVGVGEGAIGFAGLAVSRLLVALCSGVFGVLEGCHLVWVQEAVLLQVVITG